MWATMYVVVPAGLAGCSDLVMLTDISMYLST